MNKFQRESAEVGNGLNVRGSSEEWLFLVTYFALLQLIIFRAYD